jgi:thiol-disulfide isomerase/thioredoxin
MKNKPFLTFFLILLVVAGAAYVMVYPPYSVELSDAEKACAGHEATLARLEPLATGELAAFIVPDRARKITDLTFLDQQGEPRSLSDWNEGSVLFNLWATWCKPCREEMPALDRLQAHFSDNPFEVVAVSIDKSEADKPLDFYREIAIEHLPFYHDPSGDVFKQLKREGLSFGMPTSLLIASDGCLLGYLAGPADWASPEAYALVEASFGAKGKAQGE